MAYTIHGLDYRGPYRYKVNAFMRLVDPCKVWPDITNTSVSLSDG